MTIKAIAAVLRVLKLVALAANLLDSFNTSPLMQQTG